MVADAAARNSGCVQLIIYKETKESKPWVSVSISIQPSENTNTVAVHARNKQNQDNLKNYNLAPIRTDLPPPARRSPPLQRRPSRRPRTLPTSRLVPSPWRNTPRGCRKTGCSTYLKRSDENVNARAIDPVGSLRISGDRYRMCDTRANIRTSFPKTAASRDLLGWVVEAVRIEETANQDLDRGPTRRSAHAWPAWAQEQNPRVH
jgi:hypothetical protein